MPYKLFTEYRFAGRGTAEAIIIPIRKQQSRELKVIYKSVTAKVKYMDAERVNRMVDNRLFDDDINKSLVEQSYIGQDLTYELEKRLEENGGSMDREEWREAVELAEDSDKMG